ncbi:MAG: metallophosphoesterase [Actinomycetota bacterium]
MAVSAALVMVTVGPAGTAQVAEVPPGPCQRPEDRLPGVPQNVELVTVTEASFEATWVTCDGAGRPLPSDTTITYGTTPNPPAWDVVRTEEGVAFHHAVIDGLEEGTTYFYQVSSGGLPGRYDRYHPGSFTTLTLPGGKLLFSFAAIADVHIGETVSGQATSSPTEFPPAYRSELPYPEIMARAAVAEVRRRGVSFSVLPADATSHGHRHDFERLRAIVSGLGRRYVIARGSHDRPNQYEAARQECPPDGDCFRAVFFRGLPATDEPRHIFYARVLRGFTFIALDSANLATGTGELSDDQLSWLDRRLNRADERGEPAVIFFHHPVSEWSTTLAVPPLIFGVSQEDAQRFLQTIADHDVRLVINAHTHRNWISYSPWTGRMPVVEVGPSKEYPGGYSIFRVYEEGFVRAFHRLRCGFCREWVETTRWEFLGLYPHYTTGSLRDRNFVHRWAGPDVPGIPSLPFNPWPPLVPMEA